MGSWRLILTLTPSGEGPLDLLAVSSAQASSGGAEETVANVETHSASMG